MKHLLWLSLALVACSKKGGAPADDEKAKRMISACKVADDVDPKSLGDTEMREFLSNHLTVCAGGCDAKDDASCRSLDKQVANLCRVSQDVCAALCDPAKPGSLTDAACKRKK
jgi:hypothetical protein